MTINLSQGLNRVAAILFRVKQFAEIIEAQPLHTLAHVYQAMLSRCKQYWYINPHLACQFKVKGPRRDIFFTQHPGNKAPHGHGEAVRPQCPEYQQSIKLRHSLPVPCTRCMSVGAALIIAFFTSNRCNSGPVAWLSNGMMMAKVIQDHANVLIHFNMDCNVKIMVAYALHGNCFAWYHQR